MSKAGNICAQEQPQDAQKQVLIVLPKSNRCYRNPNLSFSLAYLDRKMNPLMVQWITVPESHSFLTQAKPQPGNFARSLAEFKAFVILQKSSFS
jgi:hypothetical protein